MPIEIHTPGRQYHWRIQATSSSAHLGSFWDVEDHLDFPILLFLCRGLWQGRAREGYFLSCISCWRLLSELDSRKMISSWRSLAPPFRLVEKHLLNCSIPGEWWSRVLLESLHYQYLILYSYRYPKPSPNPSLRPTQPLGRKKTLYIRIYSLKSQGDEKCGVQG